MSVALLYQASRVRRWHTNIDMGHVVDTTDGHQKRVWGLIWLLHPGPSQTLLNAALTHDDGEYMLGDIPGPPKSELSENSRSELAEIEVQAQAALWGIPEFLPTKVRRWLHFADRLDAYLMVAQHAPHALHKQDWQDARAWLLAEMDQIPMRGEDEVRRMIG